MTSASFTFNGEIIWKWRVKIHQICTQLVLCDYNRLMCGAGARLVGHKTAEIYRHFSRHCTHKICSHLEMRRTVANPKKTKAMNVDESPRNALATTFCRKRALSQSATGSWRHCYCYGLHVDQAGFCKRRCWEREREREREREKELCSRIRVGRHTRSHKKPFSALRWRFSVAVTRWSRSTQLLYIEPG